MGWFSSLPFPGATALAGGAADGMAGGALPALGTNSGYLPNQQPTTYGTLAGLGGPMQQPTSQANPAAQPRPFQSGWMPSGLQNNPDVAQSGATPPPISGFAGLGGPFAQFNGKVPMRAPDGTMQLVDAGMVSHYQSKGATIASGGSGGGSATGGAVGGFLGGLV